MFIIMLGGRKVIDRFPGLSRNPERIQRIFGGLMIFAGLTIATNLDRRFQSALLEAFPDYGTKLTAFEDNDSVKAVLKERNDQDSQGALKNIGVEK
ncbi:hypothetical protein EXM22_11735 [Oceanispirochaeta crateris]|uniref:Uncharacterized protein n=1 Tax=Oceanispirochaeta crateris TaxID=2518645 RepID=A0A5C1QRB8_9SPIO|nr:hypothetical protein [Oceanispirochaeta crateris]QEN08622.1 hypothetical protein EXM22_11735 [Oceanispirochaeta crateris]